jgi:hypothetical protein
VALWKVIRAADDSPATRHGKGRTLIQAFNGGQKRRRKASILYSCQFPKMFLETLDAWFDIWYRCEHAAEWIESEVASGRESSGLVASTRGWRFADGRSNSRAGG